jgi:two-component system, OmpR family, sensor histidine kinase VanS
VKLRTRFFVGMASLSLGVTALTWGMSFFMLEPYYLSLKRKQLVDISRQIGPLTDSATAMYKEFASLERSTTVHISVVRADGSVAYDTNLPSTNQKAPEAGGSQGPERPEPFAPTMRPDPSRDDPSLRGAPQPRGDGPPPRRIDPFMTKEGQTAIATSPDGSLFETVDPRFGVRLLFLSRKDASGDALVLSFPLSQATESARGAILFLSISCAIGLVVSALLAYLLANSATRPFGELVELSKSMASLDFSRRFESERKDEVADLGGAMNELADSLQRALAELEDSNARLREDVEREKQVDVMRREFISNVSHELKTPIALILGYAEGIQEGVAIDLAARNAYLTVIIDEARKMDEQVRDLLELSQIESGILPLHLERFDLRDIVTETLSSFGRTIEARGIEPILSLEECPVAGDRRMLGRAFVNYFSNAISHIDDNHLLAISTERKDGNATVSIYNSGPWIPEKSLELIWESYYKVDPSRKREFGGTGLGLAIVRGIVARHGGQCSAVNVAAEAGLPGARAYRPAGVRFSFSLPIAST